MTMLELNQVYGGYKERKVIKNISFSVARGEFFGILGPNGSGKTTLIKMISGLIELQGGSIKIDDKFITDFTKKQLAKKIAVLPQLSQQFFPYTVKEMVSLGRYAHHRGLFQTWTAKDEEIVQKVMRQTKISDFQNDTVTEHSGGEQQRIFLAQALVQQPEIILLDEPTNHLDLAYQKELLDLLSKSAKEEGLIVVAILHDVNLASLYCDRLLLMDDGEAKIIAGPDEVLSENSIREVYKTEVIKQSHAAIAKPQLHLLPDRKNESENVVIDETMLSICPEQVVLKSPIPLKTISSGVVGAGLGWYKNFVNRHIHKNDYGMNYREEMQRYLIDIGLNPSQTVGMITKIILEDASFGLYEEDGFSVFVVVTASVENTEDSKRTERLLGLTYSGTINTWLFVNGKLKEDALIQSIVTATEATTRITQELNVINDAINRNVTEASTDRILVAATQRGKEIESAGTSSALGSLISKAIYEEGKQAIINHLKRQRT